MKNRLFFIDVLRGIAACMVIFQHLFEVRSTWFHAFSSNYFQAGVFGVSLFFIISGFVITLSIEKSKSLLTFWIRRLFRIYPLYLFCLVAFIIIGLINGEHFSIVKILLNLFLINEPASMRIIGLSWTLTYEMIFYDLISCLVIMKFNGKLLAISCGLIILALMLAVFLNSYAAVVLIYFINFFSGGVFYLYYTKRVKLNWFLGYGLLLLGSYLIINYLGLMHVTDTAIGSRAFLPRTSANFFAVILFGLALYFQSTKIMQNRALLYLGEISYSLYLMQALSLGLFNNAFLGILSTFIVASSTYYLVERPFIKFGHNLANKFQ